MYVVALLLVLISSCDNSISLHVERNYLQLCSFGLSCVKALGTCPSICICIKQAHILRLVKVHSVDSYGYTIFHQLIFGGIIEICESCPSPYPHHCSLDSSQDLVGIFFRPGVM